MSFSSFFMLYQYLQIAAEERKRCETKSTFSMVGERVMTSIPFSANKMKKREKLEPPSTWLKVAVMTWARRMAFSFCSSSSSSPDTDSSSLSFSAQSSSSSSAPSFPFAFSCSVSSLPCSVFSSVSFLSSANSRASLDSSLPSVTYTLCKENVNNPLKNLPNKVQKQGLENKAIDPLRITS